MLLIRTLLDFIFAHIFFPHRNVFLKDMFVGCRMKSSHWRVGLEQIRDSPVGESLIEVARNTMFTVFSEE